VQGSYQASLKSLTISLRPGQSHHRLSTLHGTEVIHKLRPTVLSPFLDRAIKRLPSWSKEVWDVQVGGGSGQGQGLEV